MKCQADFSCWHTECLNVSTYGTESHMRLWDILNMKNPTWHKMLHAAYNYKQPLNSTQLTNCLNNNSLYIQKFEFIYKQTQYWLYRQNKIICCSTDCTIFDKVINNQNNNITVKANKWVCTNHRCRYTVVYCTQI